MVQAVLSFMSFAMPVPTPSTAEAWSFKNTTFPAAYFTLAATAHGLASCIMEGFDSRRVKAALRIPGGFSVPMMVTVGYPAEAPHTDAAPLSARYPTDEVFYRGEFGTPFSFA